MKPVISYLDTKCTHCIKCLKSCPMDAISIVNHQVNIDESKCIHCDVCIQNCPSRVLKVQSAHTVSYTHLDVYKRQILLNQN